MSTNMFANHKTRTALAQAGIGAGLALAAFGAMGLGGAVAGATPQQPVLADDPVPVPAPPVDPSAVGVVNALLSPLNSILNRLFPGLEPTGTGTLSPSTGYPNSTLPGQTPGYPSTTLPGQTPGLPGQNPSSTLPGQTPGYPSTTLPGQTPGLPGQTPGVPGQNPTTPGQTPGAPGQTPGLSGQSPGLPGQTPASPEPTGTLA